MPCRGGQCSRKKSKNKKSKNVAPAPVATPIQQPQLGALAGVGSSPQSMPVVTPEVMNQNAGLPVPNMNEADRSTWQKVKDWFSGVGTGIKEAAVGTPDKTIQFL